MTQYIFMRAKKFTQPPKGWIYITPILGQELAPVELIDHHNEFVRACRGEPAAKEVERDSGGF